LPTLFSLSFNIVNKFVGSETIGLISTPKPFDKATHSISIASSYFFFEGTRIKRSISLFLKAVPLAKDPNKTTDNRLKSVFLGNTERSFSTIKKILSLFFRKSSAI
ncbi:MAG: hypothetical protein ABII27_01660, partial [bacterium]